MSDLSVIDGVGFGAAGLVLATFCMHSMGALRWVAIASNVAFIAYAYLGGLAPVLLLHALLLPVNICRLAQLRSAHLEAVRLRRARRAGVTLSAQEMKTELPLTTDCFAFKRTRPSSVLRMMHHATLPPRSIQ